MSATGPRFDAAVVPDDERAHLAATLGAELARARLAAGYRRPALATAAGCSWAMLRNLELGQRRPRRSLLESLAAVLDPDDPARLTSALVAAAGDSLRPDTPASLRRRQRAVERAQRAQRQAARLVAPVPAPPMPSARQLQRMTPRQAHDALMRALPPTASPRDTTTDRAAHTPETHTP